MATNARIEFRLDKKLKEKIEKASALSGAKNITEYLTNLVDENATKVIAEHESITVENDIFDRFVNACEKASEPNKALLDAVAYTRKQGIK